MIDETYVRELEARVRNAEARAEKSENSAHDGWAEVERNYINRAEFEQLQKELEEAKLERNHALADFLQHKLALDVVEKERDEARTAERAATEAWKRLLGDEPAARAEVEKLRDVLASKHGGEPEALLRELDEARAEVERLRKEIERLNIDHLSAESRWDDDSLGLSQEIERLKNQHQTECEAMALELVAAEREEIAKLAVRYGYSLLASAIRARGGGK